VLGPIGSGKSVLLGNLIAQDIAADRGVVVVDPQGDLVRYVVCSRRRGRPDEPILVSGGTMAP